MNSTVHLTEVQIDDYLIGDLAENASLHLANCADCQSRVAEMQDAIESFKSVSLAWSERQSATLSVRPAGIQAKITRNSQAVWAGAAVAVALVIGVAVPMVHRSGRSVPQNAARSDGASTESFAAEREEQIAQDNQMLQAINQEIGAPVSSPSEIFGLKVSEHSGHLAQAATVRD